MRIHQIASGYSMSMGGAERVVRDLHVGLRSRNIEAYVLGTIKHQDDIIEGGQSLGLKLYDIREPYGIYHYVAKNVKPGDIVHVHQFPPILYFSLAKKVLRLRGHCLCTEHSTSNHRRGTLLGRALDAITYTGYEQIVAISRGVEWELLNWRPGLKGKTRVISNGVGLPFVEVLPREAKPHLKVVSIGNLRPVKNFASALQAMALLGDLDFEYQIAGKGEGLESLLRLSRELGLGSKVHFLGYVESVSELLASADIFLMPSLWEGFGLAAVQAMNASLPLVVSNVAGLRDVVESEFPCALLVDPKSPREIADGLRQLMVSPVLRLQFGMNAFQQARKYSLDQMVEQYLCLYAELASRGKRVN